VCPESGDAWGEGINVFGFVKHLSGGLVILLPEAFDSISMFQVVDGEDIVSADGGVEVGEVVVDMLCHLAV
jgi:hypothetical protein